MNHLTEEELIEYHYGERASAAQHLAACSVCSAALEALRGDLASLDSNALPVAPPRSAEYSENLWTRLKPSLIPHQKPQRSWPRFSPRAAFRLAAISAALLLAAFFAGRLWEARHTPPPVASNHSPAVDPQFRERIIVLVLGDHLDRSERLLVELNHPRQAAADPALQTTARELLTENRLYRQSARHAAENSTSTDVSQSLDDTLDDLQQLLVEVANNPKVLSLEEIKQLQKEMNTGALLFEVQVLRARIQQQARGSIASKGGSV
jgi:hypothetical protein